MHWKIMALGWKQKFVFWSKWMMTNTFIPLNSFKIIIQYYRSTRLESNFEIFPRRSFALFCFKHRIKDAIFIMWQ